MLIVEHLLTGLKDLCGAFPDKRKSEGVYSMADIGMSAFSLFFMQSESFLEYQRALEERQATSNCHSLFGMTKIPTDNHIRAMLEPVHSSYLQGAFDAALATLEDHGWPGAVPTPGWTLPDRSGRHGVFLFPEAGVPQLPDPQALKRQGRELSFHVGRQPGGSRSRQGLALDARVHRQAGRRREAGLRNATPSNAGWPPTARASGIYVLSIWAMICLPASRSPRP